MKKISIFICLALIGIFAVSMISGCTGNLNVQTTKTTLPPSKVSSTPLISTSTSAETITPRPEFTQTPVANDQKEPTYYSIDVIYDSSKQNLVINQQVLYTNNSINSISSLFLEIPPVDNGGEVKIDLISMNGIEINDIAYSNQRSLNIPLTKILLPEESVNLNINYSVSVPKKAGVFGSNVRQTNFSDWYMIVPPYDSIKGWIMNPPAAVGENMVYDIADFDVSIKLVGSDDSIVAASSKDNYADGIHHYSSKNVRGFTWSFSKSYLTLQEQYGPTTIYCYYFSGDEAAAKSSLVNSVKALLLFSDLFGSNYDKETFTIIEADFPDGMEYDGLYFLSNDYFKNYDDTPKNYLTLLSVHETAHQWWFAKVHNDQALEPWLDESLATFSELLYIEQFNPDLVNWWWEYRVNTYLPTGNVGMTIYDQNNLRTYISAVYLRGAQFLEAVRVSIGNEQFIEVLRFYAKSFKYKITTSNDLLSILESQNAESVKIIKDQYFLK